MAVDLLIKSSTQPIAPPNTANANATVAHTFTVGIEFGSGEILGIIIMPIVVAFFLVWYAIYAKQKTWIS